MLPDSFNIKPRFAKEDAGEAQIPVGRDDLLSMARNALKDGRVDDALSFVDVLVVLHPDDPELLELRGTILMQDKQVEDAMADFDRCCAKGRKSCCRGKKPQ